MALFEKPIVLAPMAGGPSTPELCAAVANAGGLGFLAGGYLTPEKLETQVNVVESLTNRPYGINLFYPSPPNSDQYAEYSKYHQALTKQCVNYPDFPAHPKWSDDHYNRKLDIALGSNAAVISFTFGYPDANTLQTIRRAGKKVVLNATTPLEIDHVIRLDCDILSLQGKAAGGHRATVLDNNVEGSAYDAKTLLRHAIANTEKPIFAGGGVGTAEDTLDLLRTGATAVIVGTRFLTAKEAGTKDTHRHALLKLSNRKTVITHAFSGKPARAISNTFTNTFTRQAPYIYPEIHYLTAGMRAEANNAKDPEHLNLWAGEGFGNCREVTAKQIIDELLPYSQAKESCEVGDSYTDVAVIGGGPRGMAVIERLVSRIKDEKSEKPIQIAWYDDNGFGSGKVWSPYQCQLLLMNTVTAQLSAFPDESAGLSGQYTSGPTFYEWLKSDDAREFLASDPILLAEASSATEDTYSSRALYGAYLQWSVNKLLKNSKEFSPIQLVARRAVSFEKKDNSLFVHDSLGGCVEAKSVVLSLGHTPQTLSGTEESLSKKAKESAVAYVPRGDASVQRAAKLPAKEPIIFRGMGLTFFDYMILLTEGRGGQFRECADRYQYVPSGKEPHIIACSRKGAPHHARGRNQKRPDERWIPRILTGEYAATLSNATFSVDVWPQIAQEVELAFTISLLEAKDVDYDEESLVDLAKQGGQSLVEWRQSQGLTETLDWDELFQAKWTNSPGENLRDYQDTVASRIENDIAEAKKGNKSGPLKAALDVFRDIRNEVRECVQYGRISGESFKEELLAKYTPTNAYLSIGPPIQRLVQMRALIEAGILTVLPADPIISIGESNGKFNYFNPSMPQVKGEATALVEARLPTSSIQNTADPLIVSAASLGLIRPHHFKNTSWVSGAVDVDPHSFKAQSANEQQVSLYIYGIPLEGLQWGTAATIRPFVNSVIIHDADAIASSILEDLHERKKQ